MPDCSAMIDAVRKTFVLVVCCVACVATASTALASDTPRQELLVVRDATVPSEHCNPTTAGEFLLSFFTAHSRGRVKVNRFFAEEPTFQWFSTPQPGERLNADAYDRSTLGAYLRKRHRQNEQFSLLELSISAPSEREVGNMRFRLTRVADDIASDVSSTYGKGALDCHTGKIMVWSLGGPGATAPTFCPEPPTPPGDNVAIVCAP